MGEIVPFKQKTLPDNLTALGEILRSKIQEGKFDPKADYAKGILQCIERADVQEINKFLLNITPIVEEIDWTSPSMKNLYSKITKNLVEKLPEMTGNLKKAVESLCQFKKIKNDIYQVFFEDDKFFEDVYKIVPVNNIKQKKALAMISDDSQLKQFFTDCFKIIISKHGLLESLLYLIVFSSCSILDDYSKIHIKKLLSPYRYKFSSGDAKLYRIINKIVENYLMSKFKNGELFFLDLFRLLALRYALKKDVSDVCNKMLDIVAEINVNEILKLWDVNFESDLPQFCFWGDFFHIEIAWGYESIIYKKSSTKSKSNFMEDLYIKLHDENKLSYELAWNAFMFFDNDERLDDCPFNYLLLGSIYLADEIASVPSDPVRGFFHAGISFFNKGLYSEAMTCFKTSLFNATFIFDENPVEVIDMSYFVQVTRKLNIYDDSISFLSKFRLLSENGLPINQGLLNEIEITKTELEYEHETRTYHKIDQFYELVAKEDFPLVQSHITELKDQSKFVLTREQLKILINKIQEKSDIIKGIKSISAKCDMLMYMHREIYDKQAAIFETMKENQSSFESLINQNTEKIIENIHKKNESLANQINMKTVQEFYHNEIGSRLWKKLDENTRKYLMLAQHLDATHQFSPADEFGFIAIEYALAIENEFKRKIIDSCLSKGQQIKYKTPDRIKIVTEETKVTLGEICMLIDKTRKVKNETDFLWPLHTFIIKNTHGKQRIFEFKNNLFEIKDKYRNPAAHPSNYTRELLNSFKALLFDEGFMKNYLEAVQVEP